jgi:hypothetical protein
MNLKKNIKNFAYLNYSTAKLYYNFFSLPKLGRSNPLLIFQMGKVGSSSVANSLKLLDMNFVIYHVHDMSDKIMDLMESNYKENWIPAARPGHLWEGQYVKKILKKHPKRWNWKIITLVRDPVARNISAFFQNLFLKYGSYYFDRKKLLNLFLNEFDHETPLVWFDREIKEVIGIDVFRKPFPKEKGYEIYQSKENSLLTIRLEDLDACASNAFREFLGIKNLKIIKSNIGNVKPYSKSYNDFLKNIKLPDAYIQKMYFSKFTRHFYTQIEIEYFIKKWSNLN